MSGGSLITYGTPTKVFTQFEFSKPLMELDTTWSFKMQEVKLGDHIMFSSSSLIDTVLVNSYKGFMFQT